MSTIAVGPLLPVASCVTGGTGVAKDLDWSALFLCSNDVVAGEVLLVRRETVACEARFVSWPTAFGVLKDILGIRKADRRRQLSLNGQTECEIHRIKFVRFYFFSAEIYYHL